MGVKVAPIDVLISMTPKPGEAYLSESVETVSQPMPVVAKMAVEVSGTQNNHNVEYTATCSTTFYSTLKE
jgi:hypothetical protein